MLDNDRVRSRWPFCHPQVRQISGNAAWLIGERLLRAVISFAVGIVVARSLGTAGFGGLSYAISFVLLFNTLWQLGLGGIVVRELVRAPDQQSELLGSVFLLRLSGAVLGLLTIVLAASVVAPPDTETRLAIAILGLGTVLYAFEGIDFWFQSEVQSRRVVVARVAALALSAAASIVLALGGAGIVLLAVAASLEYVLTGVGYVVAYARAGLSIRSWRPTRARSLALLGMSWPLIVSGLFNSINLRVDQIILGSLADTEAVGTYAAAARLSEAWYFVPIAIAASLAPSLLRTRELDRDRYRARTQQAYDLMFLLSLPLALFVTLLSGPIIGMLFGPAYAASAPILAIHIWAGPFVFMGAVLSKWLIAENLLRFSIVRHGVGAGVNVLLNLLLIPPLGGLGSALATLASYAVASFGATVLYRPAWPAARQMALAVASPVRLVMHLVTRRGAAAV